MQVHSLSDSLNDAPVIDPATGKTWQEAGGYEAGVAIPHVIQLASVAQSAWQTYMQGRADEALRNDRDFAKAMRRDAKLEGPLEERYLGTSSLEWHLESEDMKDPKQSAIVDNMTKVVKGGYRLQEMIMNLLEAVWYGKYGVQVVYERKPFNFKDMNGQPWRGDAPTIKYHEPVHGDNIGFKWDRTPYILVNSQRAKEIPNAEITMTNRGRGVLLRGTFRSRFIIHHHRTRGADFFDVDRAEAIHGVGLRDVLYWTWWLRNEWLGNTADWCERTGLGVRVWYYNASNPDSYAKTLAAAKNQTDRTNLLVPRFTNQVGKSAEGVEFVDTNGAGVELLLKLIKHLEESAERYIIGQTLSSDSEGSGLGGAGVADLHADTKSKIIAWDANNLAETLTEDYIRPLRHWMYPSEDVDVRWKFNINVPDPEKVLNACQTFTGMGGTLKADSVRELIPGQSKPEDGDEVLGGQQAMPGVGPDGQPLPGGDPTQQLFGGGQPSDEDFASVLGEADGGATSDEPAFAAA